MRDAVAGDTPGRPRHRVLPQVPALRRPRWPALSRRLMITAGVFFAAFALITVLVSMGAFDGPNLRLTRYLQGRGSGAQDIGLGVFSYLGSIEGTFVIAVLLGVALFRGLRLLAVLPAVLVLIASRLEILLKSVVPSVEPSTAFRRFPHRLPSLSPDPGAFPFPTGHL